MDRIATVFAFLLTAGSMLSVDIPVFAQESQATPEGRVLIHGREITEEDTAPEISQGLFIDFKEEMRTFVERISSFSREYRPTFGVIIEDALPLLIKSNPEDEELVFPARAFIRSIDGIMPTGVYYGGLAFDQRFKNDKALGDTLNLISWASDAGLPVFVLDKTRDAGNIRDGQNRSSESGYVYGSTTHADFTESILPDYPLRPFDENAESILSLNAVRNFAVIGNSIIYGREDEFALKMSRNNYDMLVVDVFHGHQPLSKRAVETLKYKRNGTRRLVYARVNIGTAARYLYYWRSNWREGNPSWLGRPVPERPDTHYVEYWRPEWQRYITGDTASYIYGVIDQGYDGVVLADVDIYRAFDVGIEDILVSKPFDAIPDYFPQNGADVR